jgi:hypothetical protein
MIQQKENVSLDEVIKNIVTLNDEIRRFWSKAEGWAPNNAADLLSISKLDWQVSLSKCLNIWLNKNDNDDDSGSLILAWANLGSLVEGTLKLVLCVYYDDYRNDTEAIFDIDKKKNEKKLKEPDILELEKLRQFFVKKQLVDKTWNNWILQIQQYRNAIHAYKNRDIGTWKEFYQDVRKYFEFLQLMNSLLPYPE